MTLADGLAETDWETAAGTAVGVARAAALAGEGLTLARAARARAGREPPKVSMVN